MTTLKLPPEFVYTPSAAVYNTDIPDPLFRTIAVIVGLCWQSKGSITPPLHLHDLMALRGLSKRQVQEHLKQLRDAGSIEIDHVGPGKFTITPLRWSLDGASAALDDTAEDDAMIAELCGNAENRTPARKSAPKNDAENHTIISSFIDFDLKDTKEKDNYNSAENRTPDFDELWKNTTDVLRATLPRATYHNIFAGSSLRQNGSPTSFVITVKNDAARDWLDNRLQQAVERALLQTTGTLCTFASEVAA